MGLTTIQKNFDNKLGDKKVDILKHFKEKPEKITISVTQNGSTRDVDLSEYAKTMKARIASDNKPLLTAEKVLETNIDWRDITKQSDEILVKAAGKIEYVYKSLLANKEAFDKKTLDIARKAHEYLVSRLEIISNPYYYYLNPEVFTQIPSDVIAEVAADPDTFGVDAIFSDPLIAEQEDERLNEETLQQYLYYVAKNESTLEYISKAEAIETFYTEINSAFDTISDLKKDLRALNKLKAEKEGKTDDTKLNRIAQERYDAFKKYGIDDIDAEIKSAEATIKEQRRIIAGASRALTVVENDTVLPNFNDFNDYTSYERYKQLTEDITDEQLEKIFTESESNKERVQKIQAIDFKLPEKKNAEPIKEVQTPAQKWFESFANQLRDMGLENNPIGLGLISVRNDDVPSASQYSDLKEITIQDGYQIIDNGRKAVSPAFLVRNENNEIAFPMEYGESYPEWIASSSYSRFNDVPKEHVEYLYKMAKENKLFIKSKDLAREGIGKNSYFVVNANGESELSKNMVKLEEIYQQDNNAEKIGPYTNAEYKKLFELDTLACEYEYSSPMLMYQIYKELGKKKDVDREALEKLNTAMSVELSKRHTSVLASNNLNWANDMDIMREVGDAFAISLKVDQTQTQEELDRAKRINVISVGADEFQQDLIQKMGCRDTDELFERFQFKDENHNPIVGEDSFDLMNKLCFEVLNSKEIFVNDQPITYVQQQGIKDGINKKGYLDEVNFLVSRLKKFEGNWTKNTPQYEKFAASLKALPQQIKDLEGRDINFDKLGALVDNVVKDGDDYIDVHKGQLSSRQIERVKIINRLKDIRRDVRAKNVFPGKDYDYRLAEKTYTAIAIKSKNYKALREEETRDFAIKKIIASVEFKSIKNATPEQKAQMLKTPGNKFAKYVQDQDVASNQVKSEDNVKLSL